MLVEGQSEEVFVKRTLTPYLAEKGIFVQPPIVLWTKRLAAGSGFRGGVSHWDQIRKNLLPLTRDSDAWVTTMLDFYGLPDDFPGRIEALAPGNPRDRAATLQARFAAEIGHERFLPFLAVHEFEAWIFCAPDAVAEHFGVPALATKIRNAAAAAGDPELIDHGADSHPKARLEALRTGYKETSDGPTLMEKIGVDAIRGTCPHFRAWLDKLEALAVSA